jgi:hypothetical protein
LRPKCHLPENKLGDRTVKKALTDILLPPRNDLSTVSLCKSSPATIFFGITE